VKLSVVDCAVGGRIPDSTALLRYSRNSASRESDWKISSRGGPCDYGASNREQVRRKGDAKQADRAEGNEAETKRVLYGRSRDRQIHRCGKLAIQAQFLCGLGRENSFCRKVSGQIMGERGQRQTDGERWGASGFGEKLVTNAIRHTLSRWCGSRHRC
jgi:hypothetical protein